MYRRIIWLNKNTNVISVGKFLRTLSRRLGINARLAAAHYFANKCQSASPVKELGPACCFFVYAF